MYLRGLSIVTGHKGPELWGCHLRRVEGADGDGMSWRAVGRGTKLWSFATDAVADGLENVTYFPLACFLTIRVRPHGGVGAGVRTSCKENGGNMEEGGAFALDPGITDAGNVILLRSQALMLIAGVCLLLIW